MNFIVDTFRNETAAIDLLATRFNDYLWPARKEEYCQYYGIGILYGMGGEILLYLSCVFRGERARGSCHKNGDSHRN
jgi:hypothetical protein